MVVWRGAWRAAEKSGGAEGCTRGAARCTRRVGVSNAARAWVAVSVLGYDGACVATVACACRVRGAGTAGVAA